MQVHVATFREIQITSTGDVKARNTMTIGEAATATTSIRVDVESDNANTNGYPTLKEYLEREAADGYKLQHMDQSYIITYSEA